HRSRANALFAGLVVGQRLPRPVVGIIERVADFWILISQEAGWRRGHYGQRRGGNACRGRPRSGIIRQFGRRIDYGGKIVWRGLIGPGRRRPRGLRLRSDGGRGRLIRSFVSSNEIFRDHSAFYQTGAELLRLILIRIKPSADTIKDAFSRNGTLDYIRGDVFGPEIGDSRIRFFFDGKSSELHRIAGALR